MFRVKVGSVKIWKVIFVQLFIKRGWSNFLRECQNNYKMI